MAIEFTFHVLPWNQGYEIAIRVDDPAGEIKESVVWDRSNITLDDLQYIKANLLWMVEMVQMQRFDRDEYDQRRAEFDHDWDRSTGVVDHDDDNDHQGDDIPF